MRIPRFVVVMAAALAVAACQKKEEPAPAPGGTGAAASAGGGAAGGGTILLGHVGSMTGNEATFGLSTDRGIRLALEEQNAKGGVKGRQLALKTLDNQGRPEESAVAATRLITEDRVTVLLGEVASSRSLAMAPIADTRKVPMISPSSTNPKVTKDGNRTRPYVFRVCFIDPFQGTVMAKFARDTMKISRVAVFRDVGNDYSVGLADYFSATLKDLGGQIVADESYKAGDQDFKSALTAIRSRNPEAIYVPGYYTDVALIARQARELGIKVPLMGGDGWDSSKLYEIAQGALDGSFFSNHYSHENPAPVIQDFVRRYREKWGEVPDGLAAMGYDAARVAIDAMERAPEISGAAIRDALEQTKDFDGVTGRISIDQDHNAVKAAVVLAIEGNTAKYAATIHP